MLKHTKPKIISSFWVFTNFYNIISYLNLAISKKKFCTIYTNLYLVDIVRIECISRVILFKLE